MSGVNRSFNTQVKQYQWHCCMCMRERALIAMIERKRERQRSRSSWLADADAKFPSYTRRYTHAHEYIYKWTHTLGEVIDAAAAATVSAISVLAASFSRIHCLSHFWVLPLFLLFTASRGSCLQAVTLVVTLASPTPKWRPAKWQAHPSLWMLSTLPLNLYVIAALVCLSLCRVSSPSLHCLTHSWATIDRHFLLQLSRMKESGPTLLDANVYATKKTIAQVNYLHSLAPLSRLLIHSLSLSPLTQGMLGNYRLHRHPSRSFN